MAIYYNRLKMRWLIYCVLYLLIVKVSSSSIDKSYYRYSIENDHINDKLKDVQIRQERSAEPKKVPGNFTIGVKENTANKEEYTPDNGKHLQPIDLQSHSDLNDPFIKINNATESLLGKTFKKVNSTGQIISATFESSTPSALKKKVAKVGNQEEDIDVLLNPLPKELTNETLTEHNITQTQTDNYLYYESTILNDEKIGKHYWVDLSNHSNSKIHNMLSNAHRRASTIQLSFEFPFYGHYIRNITLATGGFLFTGDQIHAWLAATQYIAPLMANFDSRINDDESTVRYLDNGTSLVVSWENVVLLDSKDSGNFTFETILNSNGDIFFVYKNLPISVLSIKNVDHPVKIGISDAYLLTKKIYFVLRKTVYIYHTVNLTHENVKNWTVIHLKALPSCQAMKDCDSCAKFSSIETNQRTQNDCKWCPSSSKCSNGVDRYRQQWLESSCNSTSESVCNAIPLPQIPHNAAVSMKPRSSSSTTESVQSSTHLMGVSGLICVFLILASVVALGKMLLYAYQNPHSTPGQFLIRYRPSQWRWRRGEARYTAATIHM